jgi:hypothetical protein
VSHQNPSGFWEHQGSFSVLLTYDAQTNHLPCGALLQERTVHVRHGRIKQSMGGIDFYADEQCFGWSYRFIKQIRDGAGNLIWQNRDYR